MPELAAPVVVVTGRNIGTRISLPPKPRGVFRGLEVSSLGRVRVVYGGAPSALPTQPPVAISNGKGPGVVEAVLEVSIVDLAKPAAPIPEEREPEPPESTIGRSPFVPKAQAWPTCPGSFLTRAGDLLLVCEERTGDGPHAPPRVGTRLVSQSRATGGNGSK